LNYFEQKFSFSYPTIHKILYHNPLQLSSAAANKPEKHTPENKSSPKKIFALLLFVMHPSPPSDELARLAVTEGEKTKSA